MIEQSQQEKILLSLTQREKEVLCCLARGENNIEIATALGIGKCTVHQHLQNLTEKLGVRGRGKLQAWAWRHGFGVQATDELDEKIRRSEDRQPG